MDAAEAEAAASPEGLALLESLPPYSPDAALSLGERLRGEGHPAETVAAALTQSRLRTAARAKFGDFADRMLFTPAGLEQASRLSVAALHAARYRRAGLERVADMTAGIGGDAMALASLGAAVMAFETDLPTAIIADHNLRPWRDAVVVHADSLATVRHVDVDALYADPGRREGASRRHHPRDYSPPLDAVLALRDRFAALGVKLGPGVPHASLPPDAEIEWVSVDGDVVEAGLWCGPLAREHGRAALVVRDGQGHRLAATGAPAPVGPVGPYLCEPDGAVIRAGVVAEAAERVGGHLVDPTIAYVACESQPQDPFLRAYRVCDDLPFHLKGLRAYLRQRGVGRLTIKKRGTAVTPEHLRRQLGLRGDGEATLVLTRVAGEQRVLVVEPC